MINEKDPSREQRFRLMIQKMMHVGCDSNRSEMSHVKALLCTSDTEETPRHNIRFVILKKT